MSELIKKLKSQKKLLLLLLAFIICGICVYYIINSFQWEQIWQVLKQANLFIFFVGSITTLILYWLARCLRWYVLLRDENKSVSFFRLYLYTAISVGFSTITPFQAGEALKVELLKKHDATRVSGYTGFAIEKILDILFILLFALIGLNAEFNDKFKVYIYIVVGGLFFFSIVFFTLVFLLPHKQLDKLRQALKERVKVGVLVQASLLTFISWILTAFGWYLALQSIGIYLDYHQMALLLSLTTLAGIISFVPGAVGVSEISISQILIKIGYEPSMAQAGALAIRGYALVIIGLAIIHLLVLQLINKRISNNKD